MTTAVLVTLAFFPIYLLIRHPFRRTPLHIDTGFYVSNSTIANDRFRYSQGWNAHFAGCSKVLPEVFYSLVYLIHCRRAISPGEKYKSMSRLWVSMFNYATAIAVGLLSMALADGNFAYYCAGLAAFGLLSSEPHYGVYHECGETLQMLFDTVAVTLLCYALQSVNSIFMAAAACVWLLGAFYVKLSSGLGFPILFATAAALSPAWMLPIAIGAAAATASFVVWIAWNGRNPMALLASLRGHEKSFNQWADARGFMHRATEKLRTAAIAARNQPIVPMLALVGLLLAPPSSAVFWSYAIAAVAVYGAQATDCRYYLIPILPCAAIVAAGGIVSISHWGSIGFAILLVIAILWIMHNPIRAARLEAHALNLWTWKGSQSALQVRRNAQLEDVANTIRPLVAGQTVLVYGAYNQAYALLGASYSTPIVAPEYYLDHVSPRWQQELHGQLIKQPPQWIMDTNRCFDAQEARRGLGLDYRLERTLAGHFSIYKLTEVRLPSPGYEGARTFGPQPAAALESEARLAGLSMPSTVEDPTTSALRHCLQSLAAHGNQRIAIYGAGRFTIRHADVYRASRLTIVGVIDDNPGAAGSRFLNWPVLAPDDVDPSGLDAIIVSTDRFTAPILGRIHRLWGHQVPAYTIAGGRHSEVAQATDAP
jgi:hypothetical protein